ncbi:DUF6094 domain-containing protein [Bacillus spizizenii]|nr:DUF6094 domain-containing protein [Bacillus spizizenii]MCY8890481.1 DUF6094 domain-containing protein [Bacillus spizizenii]MEC0841936.1 DUF6094 domain-containing protein [Bacillus spizizenii]
MLINIYYIRDSVVRFENLKKALIKQAERAEKDKKEISTEEVKAQRSNFYAIAIDMLSALSECIFAFESTDPYYNTFISTKSQLLEAIKNIKEDDTLQPIIDVLEDIHQAYEEFDYNEYSIYSYRSDFRYSYTQSSNCTIDEFYLQMLGKAFKAPDDRPIRVLDPRPRRGESIGSFKALMPENTVTYAAAVPEREGYRAKENFDRVALGTLKGSTISNDAFDVMFLQPPITLEKQSERLMIKKEKDMIRDTIKYIRPNGYLVLILPHFRFYKDICLILAKNYTDFQVRKFAGSSYDKTGSIFLIAKRKEKSKDRDKEIDPKEYQKLRHLYNIDKVENIMNENFKEVMLPAEESEVKFFRGSILDIDEIKNIVENSGSMDTFWKEQQVEKLYEANKSPLLPFNVGQLGLVLTSGSLDGIVDEGGGYYHVVKGRVVKKTDSEREVMQNNGNNEIELVETTSNRVEINVMLADGTHKVLA